jgi:hypothetical protein
MKKCLLSSVIKTPYLRYTSEYTYHKINYIKSIMYHKLSKYFIIRIKQNLKKSLVEQAKYIDQN